MALGETQNGTVSMKQTDKASPASAAVINGSSTIAEKNQKLAKQVDANTSFLRAARAGDLGKLVDFLESGEVTDINASNANGLNALHLAAKDGHIEIVRELLKRGAGVDNSTKKGNTALHIASLAGQKDVIKILIQHGADVNLQSQNGFTPLYMAAQENHDGCVRYLLSKGANPQLATEDGFTPLAVAMQQGHEKVVTVLLESDSRGKIRLPALHIAAKKDDVKAASLLLENEHNPDVSSKSGFTPLHIASHYGNIDIANLLIEKGADVNFSAKHNITPLHVACKWGKTHMVSLLISKGAKIDSTTRDGLTPLHCAARSGHEQVIDILSEKQANILAKTKNGLAPLHMAAQGEHVDAARILLYHKAPVDEVTVDYLTALHVAAHCGHVKVAKLLLDRNADPNARALNGFTPLHIACKKNRIKVVELLLKHGASKGATTESGLTPLHVASFMGCMNIVIYLLQHDASPDVPTVRGETPLHLAARANQADIIRILLRNGAQVDVKAREEQTPLHVASRLGNVDIVMMLLQHGANIDSVTKDLYTPLHIAAKEGQEEVAAVLIENGASLDAATKKGFTPLHLAGKYGNIKVAELLLQKGAPIDAQGKNGVTPLHVASHYDNQKVALLLLEKGASPHAMAKNGHTPLHIAAKKNQMDIATTLLEYGALPDAESKSGFTPIHLSAQEGHMEMSQLLLEHKANPGWAAKNGLTPLHLCAQEDKVEVAKVLLKNDAAIDPTTKAGFTPLHVAAHFGQINMVRYLLENDAAVEKSTNIGYTPLHQAAQQGHTLIINLLLKHKADPNAVTNNGQTALNIANKLGYITVVETLKVVTETNITSTSTGTPAAEEKYKVIAPEAMHETFMSDSEDEGGEDPIMSDQQQYKYMTVDDIKGLDDNIRLDTSHDDKADKAAVNEYITHLQSTSVVDSANNSMYMPKQVDNVDIVRQPIHVGFLVSFLVDARGGAMRGCRHSGVRVIVPPRSASQPTRITCRYVKPQRIPNPPPLMEGEALVSRILELTPVAAKFLGPVILEVPHFASLRDKEREIIILRSDNGETWREHTLYDSEEAIQDVLNESFEAGELTQLEDLHTNRIIRVVTHDFPHFFAVVSRIRQEVHAIGPDGGTVSSVAVPLVQAVFPPNALTKKIRVGLQAQPIDSNSTANLLGRGVAVSPVVTVEPRRRKFHKAITLSMPAPRAHTQGMINQYSGNAPTLRLLCSITGGQNRAVWEDVTGSTPLTFVKDCVSFTTTVSARFWLMDCRNITEACKMATELYTHMAYVPFMVKFVVFAKRIDANEAKLSVFCMTDDKEDKTLEQQEHFIEVAKSREFEVLEGRPIYLEFAGNLIPIMKSGDQLQLEFNAFKENRLTFVVKIKDGENIGRISFMNEPKVAKGEPALTPICTLNVAIPEKVFDDDTNSDYEARSFDKNYRVMLNGGFKVNEIHKADIRLSDICNLLGNDWVKLAEALEVPNDDVELIKSEYPDKPSHQAMVLLRLWLRQSGKQATGNNLEQALHRINRSDIVDKCIFNLELVTDEMEKAVAKMQLDQSGFDNLKDELGPSRDTSLKRNVQLDYQDHDGSIDLTNGKADRNNDDDEALQRVRDQSITLGISSTKHSLTGNETPPPSPAEFGLQSEQRSPLERTNNKIPPTAVAETSDLTHQFDNSQGLPSDDLNDMNATSTAGVLDRSDDSTLNSIRKSIDDIVAEAERQVNENISQQEDTISDVLEEFDRQLETRVADAAKELHEQKVKFSDEPETLSAITKNFIEMESTPRHNTVTSTTTITTTESRIPVSSKTSTPIKVKTIKKHSKVNRDIVKPPQPIRPAVNDIEWDVPSGTGQDDDEQITEISTLNLEDVGQNENESFAPVIISPSDDYSGEIDEVILVQTADDDLLDSENGDKIDENVTNLVSTKTTTQTILGDNGEQYTVTTTEEKFSYGDQDRQQIPEIVVRQHLQQESQPISSEDLPTMSLSLNSESDSENYGRDGAGGDSKKSVNPNASPMRGVGDKTFGSSSGSDVALHEAGAESSDDDPETDFNYQSTEHPSTFTHQTIEEFKDPQNNATVRTVTTTTTVTSSEHNVTDPSELADASKQRSSQPKQIELNDETTNNDHELRETMQQIVDQFMQEERRQP